MIHETVGQHHRPEPQAAIEHPLIGQKLGDMAAKSADRAFFAALSAPEADAIFRAQGFTILD